MTEALALLHDLLPYVGMALLFAGAWRMSNATITLQWASKTTATEPSHDRIAKLKAERDEARRVAEELRGRT